jgi:hypothetical protein
MFLAPVSMQSYFASSRFRLLTQPSANGFLVYERLSGGMSPAVGTRHQFGVKSMSGQNSAQGEGYMRESVLRLPWGPPIADLRPTLLVPCGA